MARDEDSISAENDDFLLSFTTASRVALSFTIDAILLHGYTSNNVSRRRYSQLTKQTIILT